MSQIYRNNLFSSKIMPKSKRYINESSDEEEDNLINEVNHLDDTDIEEDDEISEEDEEVEMIEEDEEYSYEVEESESDESNDEIFGQLVGQNSEVKVFISDPKLVCSFIKVWECQRKLDEKHVRRILKDQMEKERPYFYGTIKVVKFEDNFRLVDGQHRLEAARELLKLGKDFRLLVELIEVDNVEEMIRKFKEINNVKPMKVSDLPEYCNTKVVYELKSVYKRSFTKSSHPRPPHTNSKILYNKLKDSGLAAKFSLDERTLYNLIRRKNLEYKEKLEKDLSNKRISKKKRQLYRSAIEKGFVLALDTSYEWLYELERQLENNDESNYKSGKNKKKRVSKII